MSATQGTYSQLRELRWWQKSESWLPVWPEVVQDSVEKVGIKVVGADGNFLYFDCSVGCRMVFVDCQNTPLHIQHLCVTPYMYSSPIKKWEKKKRGTQNKTGIGVMMIWKVSAGRENIGLVMELVIRPKSVTHTSPQPEKPRKTSLKKRSTNLSPITITFNRKISKANVGS